MLISKTLWQKKKYNLDRLPVHNKTAYTYTNITKGNLETSINLAVMFLDCMREPHICTNKQTPCRTILGWRLNPGPSCCKARGLQTVPPSSSIRFNIIMSTHHLNVSLPLQKRLFLSSFHFSVIQKISALRLKATLLLLWCLKMFCLSQPKKPFGWKEECLQEMRGGVHLHYDAQMKFFFIAV